MYRIFLKYLLGLFLFFPGITEAQEQKLLRDRIEAVFKDVRSSERKILTDACLDTWTSSFLTSAEQDTVSRVFQELQKMRMTPAVDLRNFAECVNTFCRKMEKENFNCWLSGLKPLVYARDRRRNLIKNYLTATYNLICKNTVFSASTHQWMVKGEVTWTGEDSLRIDFKNATVGCKTLKDSVFIRETEATYYLNSGLLYGRGGRVDWRCEDSVYAELTSYRVDMTLSDYSADSVAFVYEEKYSTPIWGHLKDNALKYTRTKTNATFPQFESYAADIRIDSVFPGISFEGGIRYVGMKLQGFGTEEKPACVHISPDDTIHLYIYSRRFQIDTNRILGGITQMVLPMDTCRLFHPNINFAYTHKNRTVTLKRISEQSLQLPFRDDYHQILFNVEQLVWPVDSNELTMSMNSRSGLFKATIESLNFFNDNVYDQMQGIDEIHPLNGLHKASVLLKTRTFSLEEYAEIMKKPIDQLRKQIIALSYQDFVEYKERQDEVTLKQRLFDYTQARLGAKDYDNIRFDSHPQDSRVNAVLNLKSYALRIQGVDRFTISDVKDIYVEPSDKTVVMLKNRDMEFNGKLKAGMFDMYGNKLFFSYDKYTIGLTQVDSTGMYLADRTTGKRGNKVNSLIRDVTGDIVIDKPNNKSGKKKTSGYPVFHSTKESYVYFDDPAICNGVYRKEKFYFVIKPYTLRNINDSEKFRYAFSGTLVSNIVPDIADTLVLMKDNSLGMKYTTPGEGLPLYESGKLRSRIELSQKGFIADGQVDINRSHFKSGSLLMMPDSMAGITDLLTVDEVGGQRPGAKGEQVSLMYIRRSASLEATTTAKPFQVYENRVAHSGTLFVYPDILDAKGKLEVEGAKLMSELFHMEARNIVSDHTDLQLSSFENKNIQLNTANVRANVDLENNKGKFVNNEDANMADFPSNRYRCSFKSFTWYMKEAYLNIGIEDEKELQRIWQIEDMMRMPEQGKNIFVSTDKLCDSLSFMAPLARYNLNTGDIHCQWVNHIDLANGRFYPDMGKIYISSTGDIGEFKNSMLLCERTDPGKRLLQVQLKLRGRYSFSGSGDFDYMNQDRKTSIIHFTEIGVDTSRFIYARVDMQPEADFKLNGGIVYKGNIYLYSRQEHLFFNGYTKLTADDTYLKHTWLKVRTYFNAQDIRVPVAIENRDDRDKRIFNAVYLNVDKTVKPYAAFHSSRLFYNDEVLLGGRGELVWSGKEQRYIIRDTLVDRYYHLCYIPSVHTVSGFGKLGIPMAIPGVSQLAAGDIRYNLKEEELSMDNVLYALDFEVLNKMQAVILQDFTHKKKRNITPDSSLMAKLSGIYGKGLMPSAVKQLSRNSNNVPDSLKRFLVLDSLHIGWDAQKHSYIANGKVMLRAVLGRPVEQEYQIAMELVRRRLGNQIYLYIYDDEKWYYFEYLDKALYTLSSNAEYNDIVRNEKAEKKMIRDKEKQLLYTITLCPDSKKGRFLKRMGL